MLNGSIVELADMLIARENRAYNQNMLLEKYKKPVLSFSLNIPGPVKTAPELRRLFDDGLKKIYEILSNSRFKVIDSIEIHKITGDECLLSVDGDSIMIKQKMTALEESSPVCRLFDIDVIDIDGKKLSRSVPRRCLICNEQAQACARSRKHSVEELTDRIEDLIKSYVTNF